jgi:hypothetical protein
MRAKLPDSQLMRLTAAPLPPLEALDQSGIQFPLAADDLAWLALAAQSSVARATSWRLSLPTLTSSSHDGLDQWGIEFPIAYDELAAFSANCRGGRSQVRTPAILGGRLLASCRLVGYAAILAAVVAGSASVVPSTASADEPSTRNVPAFMLVADSTATASPTLATEQPSATANPTPGPTPGATPGAMLGVTLPIEGLDIKPAAAAPPAAALPLQVDSVALPTVQDARNYLVARLGTKVDRRFGLSQSQCASRIFEYEARWDPHATNKSSGAYGLPQANPASKLGGWAEAKAQAAAKAGDPEAAWLYRAWRDNAVVQAEWGVDYMTSRYGSPCAALTFRNGAGWY